MLYAIFCYDSEAVTCSWSKVMAAEGASIAVSASLLPKASQAPPAATSPANVKVMSQRMETPKSESLPLPVLRVRVRN